MFLQTTTASVDLNPTVSLSYCMLLGVLTQSMSLSDSLLLLKLKQILVLLYLICRGQNTTKHGGPIPASAGHRPLQMLISFELTQQLRSSHSYTTGTEYACGVAYGKCFHILTTIDNFCSNSIPIFQNLYLFQNKDFYHNLLFTLKNYSQTLLLILKISQNVLYFPQISLRSGNFWNNVMYHRVFPSNYFRLNLTSGQAPKVWPYRLLSTEMEQLCAAYMHCTFTKPERTTRQNSTLHVVAVYRARSAKHMNMIDRDRAKKIDVRGSQSQLGLPTDL